MSIVTPPRDHNRQYTSRSSARPITTRAKATLIVTAIWAVAVTVASGGSGLGDILFGIVSPIFGFMFGTYSGLFVGFGAMGHLFSWVLLTPIAVAGILGALAGAATAWLRRAFELKNELAKSLVSSLFSLEIWKENAAGFLCQLVVCTLVGYSVAAGFSSIGVFDAGTTNLGTMAAIVLGSGGGGGLEGEFISWIIFFFAVLAALLVAGGIIGACAGGIFGAIIGAGFSSIGANTVIQGAAEGTVFRFFSDFRPDDLRSGRLSYLLAGAGKGAGESIFIGAAVGMVLFIARFIGVVA